MGLPKLQDLSPEDKHKFECPKDAEDINFRASWFQRAYLEYWNSRDNIGDYLLDSFFENGQCYHHEPEGGWNLDDVLQEWERPTPSVLRDLGYLQSESRRRLD